jgi:hypothetical protein
LLIRFVVVSWLRAPLVELLRQVACELHCRPVIGGRMDAGRVGRIELSHFGRLLLEEIAVGRRDSEQFGDDRGRQRGGELTNQIGTIVLAEVIEQLAGDFADARLELRDASRRERTVDQGTQLPVSGSVHHDQKRHRASEVLRAAVRCVFRARDLQAYGDPLSRAVELGVLKRRQDVFVSRQDEEVSALFVVDRELLAQPAVDRVGVLMKLRVIGVEPHAVSPKLAPAVV